MHFKTSSLVLTSIFAFTAYASPIIILEKQVKVVMDSKIEKPLMVNAFNFEEQNTKTKTEPIWIAVFPYEKNLYFLINVAGENFTFPVTHIVSATSTSEMTIDPTADNTNSDKTSSQSALITVKLHLSTQLQTFKEFSILLAKGNKKALSSFIEKHSVDDIKELVAHAMICQGECFISFDDAQTLESLMQAKKPLAQPVTFKGTIDFLPAEVIQELINEAKRIEKA